MASEPVFRTLDATDLAALVELFARNDVAEVTRTFDPFPLRADTAHELLREGRLDRCFGAFDGESLLAFSMLRGRDEGYDVPSFGILVDRGAQGRGLGSRLTAWTVEQAREAGMPAVRLSVYASNPGAFRIYKRLGFEVQSRESLIRDGRPDERVVMIKSFSEPR